MFLFFFYVFSSRRRHTRFSRDWSSDVCSSDLRLEEVEAGADAGRAAQIAVDGEPDLASAHLRQDADQARFGVTEEARERAHAEARCRRPEQAQRPVAAEHHASAADLVDPGERSGSGRERAVVAEEIMVAQRLAG